MAASIYATPPPDLGSEDTALSDVSNTSTSTLSNNNSINNSNNNINNITNNYNNNNSGNNDNNSKIRHNHTNNNISSSSNNNNNKLNNNNNHSKLNNEHNRNNINKKHDDTLNEANVAIAPAPPPTTLESTTKTSLRTKTTLLKAKEGVGAEDEGGGDEDVEQEEEFAETTNDLVGEGGAAEDSQSMTAVHATTAAMAAFAAAANAAMQLKWLESLNEAAKKRRKQNHPNRLGADNENDDVNMLDVNEENNIMSLEAGMGVDMSMYLEENLQKMLQFKETMQLLKQQQKHNMDDGDQEQQQDGQEEKSEEFSNISQRRATKESEKTTVRFKNSNFYQQQEQQQQHLKQQSPTLLKNSPYYTFCKKCGENFENDIQLSLHMLQEHNKNQQQNNNNNSSSSSDNHQQHQHYNNSVSNHKSDDDNSSNEALNILSSVKVKLEQPEYDEATITTPISTTKTPSISTNDLINCEQQQHHQQQQMHSIPNTTTSALHNEQDASHQSMSTHNLQSSTMAQQSQQWPAMVPPMMPGFPFGPEAAAAAAAALSARGYLPLLGMPGFPTHPSMDGLNRPPLRIFNPEAYCDLCNKEFCNKYFLRKHKSNKHGIYDPLMTPSAGIGMGTGADSGESHGAVAHFQQQYHQQQIMDSTTATIKLEQTQQQKLQNMDVQQQQVLTTTTTSPNTTTTTTAVATAVIATTATATPVTIAMPTPASLTPVVATIFCDICSKRFTNNFALWRHRAKAHEQQQQQTITQAPSTAITSVTSEIVTNVTTPTMTTTLKPTELEIACSTTATTSTVTTTTTTTATTSSKVVEGDEATKSFHLPDNFRTDFSLEQEEVNFTPQPRQLSPQSVQQAREANFAHEKLKRLGVLNPEAFCELCGKEYCNKYFLRTHKLKRHGLLMPPDDEQQQQQQQQQLHMKAWPFMSMPGIPSPLNFMLGANENAVVMQRMLAAAAAANNLSEQNAGLPPTKRIKLETEETETNNSDEEGLRPLGLEADAALQNLQKLQTMIQQLNASEPTIKQPVVCRFCGREVEHQYALQAHIMSEHNGAGIEGFPLLQSFQQGNTTLGLDMPCNAGSPLCSELRCQQCERDFGSLHEFKQHIREVHLTSSNALREDFMSPERVVNTAAVGGASANSRPPYTLTPTSSYCEICNKELCNKYFMKTHMQRMHGIEIENGAQIGGVVCNICNKELCSKYFLRVHKQNTHGIVEEGVPLPQPRQNQNGLVAAFEAQQQQQQQQQQQLRQQQVQQQQQQMQQQLDNDFGRGVNVSPFAKTEAGLEACPLCARRFRSFKLMRAHLLSDHGSGEKVEPLSKSASPTLKIPNGNAPPITLPGGILPHMFGGDRSKNYKCAICPFCTPNYTLLYMHELTHTLAQNQEPDAPNKSVPSISEMEATSSSAQDIADNEPKNLSTRAPSQIAVKCLDVGQNNKVVSLEEKLTTLRTTATSPIFPALQELAKQHSKPVSYALPKEISNTGSAADNKFKDGTAAAPHQMQAFLLEAAGTNSTEGDDTESSNRFVPAIIYLPVRESCSGPMTVWFKLTPF